MINNAATLTVSDACQTAKQPTLQWLAVVAHIDPRFGGMAAAVPKLSSCISSSEDVQVALAAFCVEDEVAPIKSCSDLNLTSWPLSRKAWLRDRQLSQRFSSLAQTMDGVHIHGLWDQSTQIGASVARSKKLPYVISAHGMLEPWALNNKKWKKWIYSALIERSNVSNANCLHALTHAEANNYRQYCRAGTVAVIPNGVEVPEDISPSPFFSQYPQLRGKRIVLFLGRIHFKKGLDILVKAWRKIALNHPDAHLVLAGPDSEDSRFSVAAMIGDDELEERVTFTGMLQDSLKWSAFAAAECFVLPSYSEGLSIAALEAMGAGVPVILSDRCNLPEVAQHKAGWIIPANENSLRTAIEELLENSSTANRAIGQRGRALVQERYTWKRVAFQMSEVYAWVAGGHRPVSVELQTFGGRG
jgi:glycosyltransferase involved in cell wall biosynthesis